MLDHAAAGGDVEHVELVDRRRHEQQRNLPHLLGRGLVLDQLEHVGAQHDGARRDREVAADFELARVDRRGKPWRSGEVVRKLSGTANQVLAAGVDRLLDHLGVRPREVRGGERVDHVPRSQPGAALRAPVDVGVGDQAVDRLADRKVALEEAAKQPTTSPGRVGEAPVASRGCDVRAAPRDSSQLGGEARGTRGDAARMAGEPDAHFHAQRRGRGSGVARPPPPRTASRPAQRVPRQLVRRTRDGFASAVVFSLISLLKLPVV